MASRGRPGEIAEASGLWGRVIPPELCQDAETFYRTRAIVIASVAVGVLGGATVAQSWWSRGLTPASVLGILGALACFSLPLFIWWTRSEQLSARVLSAIMVILLPLIVGAGGVFPAPALALFPAVALSAVLFAGRRMGAWATFVLSALVLGLAASLSPGTDATHSEWATLYGLDFIVATILVFWLAQIFESSLKKRAEAIELINVDLSRAQADANAANRAKSTFLANMSHELRTPLTAILGYSELLQDEFEDQPEPQQQLQDLRRVNGAGESLLELVNEILDLSRMEAGSVKLEPRDVDLRELIRGVEDDLYPYIHTNKNTIEVTIDDDSTHLRIDANLLRQALGSLLKFEGKRIRNGVIALEVKQSESPARLQISIRDQHQSIELSEVKGLFEPFAPLPGFMDGPGIEGRFRRSVGLDLAIARRCCTLLGGKVASIRADRGVELTISLPVVRGSAPQHRLTAVGRAAGGEELSATAPLDLWWIRTRALMVTSWCIALVLAVMVPLRSVLVGWEWALLLPTSVGVLCGGLPFVVRFIRNKAILVGVLVGSVVMLLGGMQVALKQFPTPSIFLFPVTVLIATCFGTIRLGLATTVLVCAAIASFTVMFSPASSAFISANTWVYAGVTVSSLGLAFLIARQYHYMRELGIEELQRLKLRLEGALERAIVANRAKSVFLSRMSLEVRAPLDAILGYSELIAEELPDTKGSSVVDDLGRIASSGRHLLDLVNEILDLSRIESGNIKLRLEEVPLREFVERVRDTVMPLASRGGNTLTVEWADEIRSVTTDPLRLRQVLVNLLSNACKFTHKAGITLIVERAANDRVCFRIRDEGVGM
ncbi:MAG TPA: hypothetical protein ENJ18_05070, partial [Nannocystis exedens]|nr:hypothetical protein [Nannocystis exedens]